MKFGYTTVFMRDLLDILVYEKCLSFRWLSETDSEKLYFYISDQYNCYFENRLQYINHMLSKSIPTKKNYILEEKHNKEKIEEIRQDKSKLINFLQHIIQLESAKISMEKRFSALVSMVKPITVLATRGLNDCFQEYHTYLSNVQRDIDNLENEITAPERKEYVKLDIPPKKPMKPFEKVKPVEPLYKEPGFLNKKRIEAENNYLKEEYNAKLREYENELKGYEVYKTEYQSYLLQYIEEIDKIKEEEKRQNEIIYLEKTKEFEIKKQESEKKLSFKKTEYEKMKNNKMNFLDDALLEKNNHFFFACIFRSNCMTFPI